MFFQGILRENRDLSGKIQPTSLTVEHTARILSAAGGKPVSEDMVQKDIDAGAPVNPDGTINLVHYAAWLVRNLRQGSGGQGEMARGD